MAWIYEKAREVLPYEDWSGLKRRGEHKDGELKNESKERTSKKRKKGEGCSTCIGKIKDIAMRAVNVGSNSGRIAIRMDETGRT